MSTIQCSTDINGIAADLSLIKIFLKKGQVEIGSHHLKKCGPIKYILNKLKILFFNYPRKDTNYDEDNSIYKSVRIVRKVTQTGRPFEKRYGFIKI